MERNNADSIMKTVFKNNVGQSYIQLQYNRSRKKNPQQDQKDQQDKELKNNIEKNVDFNSGVLARNHNTQKGITTLKKQGFLYNAPASGGLFACFCASRRAELVTLENRVLTVSSSNSTVIETVNFDTLSVDVKIYGNSLRIKLQSEQKQEIYLEATQTESASEWEAAIRKAVDGSQGAQHELSYLRSVPRFWETLSIGSLDFSSTCNSGDIVLFKSSHGMAKFQRGVTGSEYDHIALILKNVKGEVLLFESNSDTGVAVTFWKDMVRFKWYEGAEKVAYRALRNVERDEQFLATLEGFVANNLDKKFGIGIGKLMKFTSKLGPQKEEADRTFFCSELVAKAYKELGLLEPAKSATQYWPGCFSHKGGLVLLRGDLGPETVICFDRQLCKK